MMILPAALFLVLLTATGTEANHCSFSLDCANVMDSMSEVCASFEGNPEGRRRRDTLSVDMLGNASTDPGNTTLTSLAADPKISGEEGLMLHPRDAFTVFKVHRVGGRHRRYAYYNTNPYDECCADAPVKTCTLHEVADYCITFRPQYRFLANGRACT